MLDRLPHIVFGVFLSFIAVLGLLTLIGAATGNALGPGVLPTAP